MVLVPIHRVTRRLLGLIAVILALVAVSLLLIQMRHVYQQHQKFKRYESYSKYVDDITNDLLKLETIANQSNLSVDQMYLIFGQHITKGRHRQINVTQFRNNASEDNADG